jgi:hypothetical protein
MVRLPLFTCPCTSSPSLTSCPFSDRALHHLLKAMRRALRDDGHAGWDPTWYATVVLSRQWSSVLN